MTFAKDQQKILDFKKEMNTLEMMTFSRENKRRLFDEFSEEGEKEKIQNNFQRANRLPKEKSTKKENAVVSKRKEIEIE